MLEGIAQENRRLAQRAGHPTRHSEAETVSVRALIASTYFSYSQKMCNYPANLRSNSPQPRIVGPLSSMRILSMSEKNVWRKYTGMSGESQGKLGKSGRLSWQCRKRRLLTCPRTSLTSNRRTTAGYSMIEVDVVSV